MIVLVGGTRHASPKAALSGCPLVKSASKVRGKVCAAALSGISKPRAVVQVLCNELLGLRQQASGAVSLSVTVNGGSRVNGALSLQSGLVLARGPAAALAAVLDPVEEIDGETCGRDKRQLERQELHPRCGRTGAAVPTAIQTVNRIHVLISSCIMRYMLTKILNKGNQGTRGT